MAMVLDPRPSPGRTRVPRGLSPPTLTESGPSGESRRPGRGEDCKIATSGPESQAVRPDSVGSAIAERGGSCVGGWPPGPPPDDFPGAGKDFRHRSPPDTDLQP